MRPGDSYDVFYLNGVTEAFSERIHRKGLERPEADSIFDGEASLHSRAAVVTEVLDGFGRRRTRWYRVWLPQSLWHKKALERWVRAEYPGLIGDFDEAVSAGMQPMLCQPSQPCFPERVAGIRSRCDGSISPSSARLPNGLTSEQKTQWTVELERINRLRVNGSYEVFYLNGATQTFAERVHRKGLERVAADYLFDEEAVSYSRAAVVTETLSDGQRQTRWYRAWLPWSMWHKEVLENWVHSEHPGILGMLNAVGESLPIQERAPTSSQAPVSGRVPSPLDELRGGLAS